MVVEKAVAVTVSYGEEDNVSWVCFVYANGEGRRTGAVTVLVLPVIPAHEHALSYAEVSEHADA
jgi:hypothetical protein